MTNEERVKALVNAAGCEHGTATKQVWMCQQCVAAALAAHASFSRARVNELHNELDWYVKRVAWLNKRVAELEQYSKALLDAQAELVRDCETAAKVEGLRKFFDDNMWANLQTAKNVGVSRVTASFTVEFLESVQAEIAALERGKGDR